jgi:hypothetical protein
MLTYYVEIYGPSNELVPLRMVGSLSVSPSSSGFAGGADGTATWGIGNYTALLEGTSGGSISCGSSNGITTGVCADSFSTLVTLRSFTNDVRGQALGAFLSVSTVAIAQDFIDTEQNITYVGISDVRAVADPFFEIDPTWAADHPGYSLEFSSSIVNGDPGPTSGGVPEPAAWALMIAGFGMAGAALRRRRTAAA